MVHRTHPSCFCKILSILPQKFLKVILSKALVRCWPVLSLHPLQLQKLEREYDQNIFYECLQSLDVSIFLGIFAQEEFYRSTSLIVNHLMK